MKNKKDKTMLLGIGITALLVVISMGILAFTSFRRGQIAMPVVAIVIGIFAIIIGFFYLRNRYSEVEKGQPLVDERGKRVTLVAASRAYIASIWFLLILAYLSNNGVVEFEDPGQALGVGIIGMAVILGLSWLWYSRKENVEEIGF